MRKSLGKDYCMRKCMCHSRPQMTLLGHPEKIVLMTASVPRLCGISQRASLRIKVSIM